MQFSTRFDGAPQQDYVKIGQDADADFPYDWATNLGYSTAGNNLTIPDAGQDFPTAQPAASNQVLNEDSVRYLGQFVAPIPCRLVWIGVSCYTNTFDATNMRVAVLKSTIADYSDPNALVSTPWKCLGVLQTSPDWVPPGSAMVIKNSIELNSSDGDVEAGDILGFAIASLASNTWTSRGVMTALLEG